MGMISWNENMSVNVVEIDDQHKKLTSLINAFYDVILQGKSNELLGETIDGLVDYTETHFAKEEHYFAQFHYPEAEEHKNEHSYFVNKVSELQKDFAERRIIISTELVDFLLDWLVNHIQRTDKKYSSFFNENGVN